MANFSTVDDVQAAREELYNELFAEIQDIRAGKVAPGRQSLPEPSSLIGLLAEAERCLLQQDALRNGRFRS